MPTGPSRSRSSKRRSRFDALSVGQWHCLRVRREAVPQPLQQIEPFIRCVLATLGFTHTSPIMALGVLTLTVSPELKLTDLGLVDATRGVIVPLIVED